MDTKKYADWIDQNVTKTYGKCEEYTELMAKAFPELTRVRGHYHCFDWGKREHWWLVTKEGQIIDPTSAQFPSKGLGNYEPWIEGTKEPTGKCIYCGGYAYDGNIWCSDECKQKLIAYHNFQGKIKS